MTNSVNLVRRLSLLAKAGSADADRRLQAMGATLPIAILLRHIREQPGLAQHELAARSGVEPATTARHLERLEREGTVLRIRDSGDRRVVRVSLTAAGAALEAQLAEVSASTDALVCAAFSDRELATLHRLLERLEGHLAALASTDQPD